ncbi:hypothetical protein [Bacillus mycoides]|uniref:Uncharacterized protein n=1 Tax=Bacillus mycoides TaxID=1405 RepID=A0A1G4EHS7_BACMY|nr:hypothetical protein [Bacillus mycoides]SCB67378.1 Uncharacterized protein BWGO95_01501 [Bacillus mycoides]
MIVESVGSLDCRLFAEVLVRITRNDILNGTIKLEKHTETEEAEAPKDKKE